MPAHLFLMWTLPIAAQPSKAVNGTANPTGSFFWATTKAGQRADLISETKADNDNKSPLKRPSWLRD
ncbi:hypothetical protein BXY66_4040 [Shimia isoporae]|uniref:Uncharacterized protein n=1 Tax=Shimia isoporae TaxID=647720 RepID=A0A4R1N022_9RHOB|nr:hypothetical protein [Shimia isoporae]TCK98977.1 hypothetical protein BXY66_4040 [Shimia isoporae]